jgi:hypothetical protein
MSRNADTPRPYHFFVLGMWMQSDRRPGQPIAWRISLENPHTAERNGFTTVDDLAAFLSAWMAQRVDDGQELAIAEV